jgi:hypothetical protein
MNYCLEEPYRTPEGYRDIPFTYVFNGNSLTDGQSPTGLTVAMDGDPFILRRVAGANNVAGFFQYYNSNLSQVFCDPVVSNDRTVQWGVIPEKPYPHNGQIRMDFGTVLRRAVPGGGLVAYVAFSGVKRVIGKPAWPTVANYPYRLEPFIYTIQIPVITWTNQSSGVKFQLDLRQGSYDFELYRVTQVETAAAGIVAAGQPVTGLLAYQFYDQNGYTMLSNAPIPDVLCIDTAFSDPTTFPRHNPGIFPVPAIVFPVGGQILFDAYALNPAGVADSVEVAFHGANRVPCR